MRSPQRSLAAIAVAVPLFLAACGDGEPTSLADEEPAEVAGDEVTDASGDPVERTIVAEGIAWDVDTIAVPVGTIVFEVDNQDEGIPHNLRVTGNGVDAATELESGIVTQTLEVTFDRAGSYEFICDVHPNMVGTVDVG